jgi:5-methylcytosine-specific restriction endonuclease McrA
MTLALAEPETECSAERCGKVQPNGMCRSHYQRAWRKANAEHLKAKKAEWYQQNRETVIQRSRVRQDADPERAAAYRRRWAVENAEHKAQLDRAWVVANRDRYLLHMKSGRARRKARMAAAPVCDFTSSDWLELLEEHEHRCYYCGSDEDLQQEHKIPIVRGGSHTKSNIVPGCKRCNLRKGRLTDGEFGNKLRALLIPRETDG